MYLRLKFTAGAKHFNTVVATKSIVQWIREALTGETAVSALPSAAFELINCVKQGSLDPKITATSAVSASTDPTTAMVQTYLQFEKRHNQNDNFVSLYRIHQTSHANLSFSPRMYSANGTNVQPSPVNTSHFWTDSAEGTTYMTHGLDGVEFQFFISQHWVIWSTIDSQGRGGTAGLFDVESTGQDVWAKTLNSLYTPQFFLSAHGGVWPSTTTLRISEVTGQRSTYSLHSNLMYNGDSGFVNRGASNQSGIYGHAYEVITPLLYPDPRTAIFPTRDNIGDTQNYMIPVYFYTNVIPSVTIPANRALLTGRVPFLWRTSDTAAQTGQTASVGGVEYRFVRLHPCGQAATAVNVNAATYMVPTSIGEY